MICRSSASIDARVVADFLQRMREHPQQQRLVRLARAEQTHVGLRGRRQQAAQGIERLGADDRSVDPLRVFRRLRILRAKVRFERGNPPRVGVECPIERVDEPCAERRAVQFRGNVILPPAVRSIGVRARSASIARDTPSTVPTRAPWSGCSRRPRTPGGRSRAGRPNRRRTRPARGRTTRRRAASRSPPPAGSGGLHLRGELVEKQPAQRFRRARVSREQRALHRFRQVLQPEHRAIGVGEVRCQRADFIGGEGFDRGGGRSHR